MPRLSIIIPWWDENPALEDTLVSVLTHRPHDCEILVVHNQPYADPWELAGEVEFLPCEAASEMELLQAGVAASRSDVVHVLRVGCEALEGWTDAACARLRAEPGLASVVPLTLLRDRPERLVAAGVTYGFGGQRRLWGAGTRAEAPRGPQDRLLGPALSAGFYRRSSLVEVGTWDVTMGESWADLDLALTLRSAGWQTALEPASRVLAAREPAGRWSFASGRSAERFYRRHAETLAAGAGAHWLAVLGSYAKRPSWSMWADAVGRLVGTWQRRDAARATPGPDTLPMRAHTPATPSASPAAARRAA